MKKLDFIFFDAGGGHRAAANALRQVMERQQRPLEIRMVNLQELLDQDSHGSLPEMLYGRHASGQLHDRPKLQWSRKPSRRINDTSLLTEVP